MEQLIQGSSQWLAWRLEGLGGSEIPAVMGLCDYKTCLDVWKLKTGRVQNEEAGYAAQRGNRFEAAVRARYELFNEEAMPATLVQHPRFEFIRASLDGLSADRKRILEIKVPKREVIEMARSGIISPNYRVQCEYQLLASGAEENHFVAAIMEGKGQTERVIGHELVIHKSDPELRRQIIAAAFWFWGLVLSDTPPPLSNRDYKEITDERAIEVFQNLSQAKRNLQALEQSGADRAATLRAEKDFEAHRLEAIKYVDHPRVRCADVSIVRSEGKKPRFTVRVTNGNVHADES